MSNQPTIEILFHGLIAFSQSNGQLVGAFLRGAHDNPVHDHVVSITLQENPGRKFPNDLLPFPLPLLIGTEEDIQLRVEGPTAPPLTFDPGNLITLNGPGFNDGDTLTVGNRFGPRFYLNNGEASGTDDDEVIVIQPNGATRKETRSFIVLAQVKLGPRDKAVMKCGTKEWEFYNLGDGTTYRLWVSYMPDHQDRARVHHLPAGHFNYYYAYGFPDLPKKYALKTLEERGRFTYERPCMPVYVK